MRQQLGWLNQRETGLERMKRQSSAIPEMPAAESAAPFSLKKGAPVESATVAGIGAKGRQTVQFSGFRLLPEGTLLRDKHVVHLPPKELAALRLLLAYAGQIVSPAELKTALWGDVNVTADSLPRCMSSLRARLLPEECIQTVYKRGYRFVATVQCQAEAAPGPLARLAILPFAPEYGVPAHLGQAVAEDAVTRVTNGLGAQVAVMARDSVFTLAQRGLTAQEVGKALKADLVLAGTLRALVDQYRLRVEMIRVEDGTQIWVEDILTAKDRIAGLETTLMDRLKFRLGVGRGTAAKGAPGQVSLAETENGFSIAVDGLQIEAGAEQAAEPRHREAYEIFQRARYEWQTLERHRMQDGLQHLSRAAELDPTLLAAKIDLAHLCVTQAFYGFMAPRVAADLVRRTAESIPDYPREAEAILPACGWVSFHADHNLPAALWAFSYSAHLQHDPWTTRVRAMFALSRHRFDEGIEILQSALYEDPYSPWLHNRLAWALHLCGRADESLKQTEEGIRLFPEHEGTSLYGAVILAWNGEAARAVELAEELALRLPYFDLATAVHAYALARAGRKEESFAMMERLQWMSRERFVMKSFNPAVYLALGDQETALNELRGAREDRCPWFFQTLADPRLQTLHGRPEFAGMQAVLTQMEAAAASQPESESWE